MEDVSFCWKNLTVTTEGSKLFKRKPKEILKNGESLGTKTSSQTNLDLFPTNTKECFGSPWKVQNLHLHNFFPLVFHQKSVWICQEGGIGRRHGTLFCREVDPSQCSDVPKSGRAQGTKQKKTTEMYLENGGTGHGLNFRSRPATATPTGSRWALAG